MPYYASLGGDISAESIRRRDLAKWMESEMRSGVSEEQLRTMVASWVVMGGQPPGGHPCRGMDGRNTCTPGDLAAAVPMAYIMKKERDAAIARQRQRQKKPGSGRFPTKKIAMVAGIGLVALMVLVKPQKGR